MKLPKVKNGIKNYFHLLKTKVLYKIKNKKMVVEINFNILL